MSLKYTDVELDKITASKYQQHLLVNYEKQRMNIQTPWMTLTHYGIPKCDKFHTTEESRRYLQIPLNDDKFIEFIHSLDEYFNSENFRNTCLNEKQRSFNYMTIFKEGKNNYPPSMKIKMHIYDDIIKTDVYHKIDGEHKECDLQNMDDVKRAIPYMSECIFIFKVNRIWFMSKNYGVQLKLMKVLIKPPTKENTTIEFIE